MAARKRKDSRKNVKATSPRSSIKAKSVALKGASKARVRKSATSKRSVSKGAVRKSDHKSAKPWGAKLLFLFKGLLVVSVLSAGAFAVDWRGGINALQSHINKPVASVSVKGEFKHLSQNNFQRLVVERLKGNFMQVNIGELSASLHDNPWVKTVSVQRVWPDALAINVIEEKPIARWNNDSFINNEGEVVAIGENSQLNNLPLLAGPVSQSSVITKAYLDMTEMLASRGLMLNEMHVDNTHAWSVELNNGIEIKFGQYDVLNKLRNFLLVYDQKLQRVSEQIKRVDMRYDSGMAVAWNNQGGGDLRASR